MIDFIKAVDTVDHAVLLSKLINYNVSPPLVNSIISFLTGRSQVCKVSGILSDPCPINQGIVQASGTGPELYIVLQSVISHCPLLMCSLYCTLTISLCSSHNTPLSMLELNFDIYENGLLL